MRTFLPPGIPSLSHLQAAAIAKGRLSRAIVLSLGSALALSSCTFTVYLSQESVEKAIAEGYQEQTQIALDSISCPEEMAATAGEVYECSGKNADVSILFTVRPTGEGTDLEWETAQIAMTDTAVEELLKVGIEEQIEVTLDSINCPGEMIAEVGHLYECTVTTGEETATVVVEPTGEDTHFNWSLKQSS
ncbi:DUF4333 domain-containing protein [Pseudanabaena sp. FACHB-2040]|uniref:DUF4333 domain-containing protein n=1 Tax=Pseudanabaena sp. FACHB-2040 TaxID=2692859 RepID=UPI001684C0B8|nr:DUF4333 domain-containing protein [Pseudanabaena sp. FACHB-2040]MBD2257725.1 DUF4333 domain-containing protein [Pseudanabaena sp. FACHB-2040]